MTAENDIETRLWTADGFREDDWRRAEDAENVAGNGRYILPLEVFLALEPAEREAAADRLGVEIQPGEAVEELEPFLDTLPLVALAFPRFADGRSFSKAALLRSRYGYKGEVRAMGEVLIDQIAHMLRCGFSAFEVSHPVALKRLEEGQRGGIPLYYQPTVGGETRPGRFAWRRVPA